MAGRARLIWAANTADVTSRMFPETWLACRGEPLGLKRPEPSFGERVPDARFRSFYSVAGDFRILPSPYPSWRVLGGPKLREWGKWEVNVFFPREVLPYVDLLQTRDFRLAAHAVGLGVPTIYEDHSESFHRSIQTFPDEIVGNDCFLLAAATTRKIRERLIARGIPAEKTAVVWSGLNEASLQPVKTDKIARIRKRFLTGGCSRLMVYAGGLQPCRGVEMILGFAERSPETCFVILGGGEREVNALRGTVAFRRLLNVRVVGYLPHHEIPSYLQAADALLLPYADAEEAEVTSPLKFFEYLAAARPIVAARLPELEAFTQLDQLGVHWCEIGEAACFEDAVRRTESENEVLAARAVASHRDLARHYTWEQRQRYLFRMAGVTVPQARGLERRSLIAPEENGLASLVSGLPESA